MIQCLRAPKRREGNSFGRVAPWWHVRYTLHSREEKGRRSLARGEQEDVVAVLYIIETYSKRTHIRLDYTLLHCSIQLCGDFVAASHVPRGTLQVSLCAIVRRPRERERERSLFTLSLALLPLSSFSSLRFRPLLAAHCSLYTLCAERQYIQRCPIYIYVPWGSISLASEMAFLGRLRHGRTRPYCKFTAGENYFSPYFHKTIGIKICIPTMIIYISKSARLQYYRRDRVI